MFYTPLVLLCSLMLMNCVDQRELDPKREGKGYEDGPSPNNPYDAEKIRSEARSRFISIFSEDVLNLESSENLVWPSGRMPVPYFESYPKESFKLNHRYDGVYNVNSSAELKSILISGLSGQINVNSPLIVNEPMTVRGAKFLLGSAILFENGGAFVFDRGPAATTDPVPEEPTATCKGLTHKGPILTSLVVANRIEGLAKVIFKDADNHLSFVNLNHWEFRTPEGKISSLFPNAPRTKVKLNLESHSKYNVIAFSDVEAELSHRGPEKPSHIFLRSKPILPTPSVEDPPWTPGQKKSTLISKSTFSWNSSLSALEGMCPSLELALDIYGQIYSDLIFRKTVDPQNSKEIEEVNEYLKSCWTDPSWPQRIKQWSFCGSI